LVFVAACQPITVGPNAGAGTPTTGGQAIDRTPLPKIVTPREVAPPPSTVSPAAPKPATAPATTTISTASTTADAADQAAPPPAPIPASPETVPPAPPAPTLVAVAPPPFDPAFVMRQSPDELARQLGPAAVVRTEGPAHIWQYQLAACVADFFFYPKAGQTDQLQVMAWHARSPVIGQPLDMAACRAALTELHHAILAG
jgi:hypothetical protein